MGCGASKQAPAVMSAPSKLSTVNSKARSPQNSDEKQEKNSSKTDGQTELHPDQRTEETSSPHSPDGRGETNSSESVTNSPMNDENSPENVASCILVPDLFPVAQLIGSLNIPTFARLSPDRNIIITASKSPIVHSWNVSELALRSPRGNVQISLKDLPISKMKFEGHEGSIISVDWMPKGHQLASTSNDHFVRIWSLANGECLGGVELESPVVAHCVRYSPKGKFFALGCSDSSIRIFRSSDVEELLTLQGHSGAVNCVEFSPNGLSIVSVSDDSKLCVWDVKSGEKNCEFQGHSDGILTVKWSPDGLWIASGSRDKSIGIFGSEGSHFLRRHADAVTGLGWTSNTTLWSCSLDGSIICWDVVEQQILSSLTTWQNNAFGSVSSMFVIDDAYLVACTQLAGCVIWTVGTSQKPTVSVVSVSTGAASSSIVDASNTRDSLQVSGKYSRAGRRVRLASVHELMPAPMRTHTVEAESSNTSSEPIPVRGHTITQTVFHASDRGNSQQAGTQPLAVTQLLSESQSQSFETQIANSLIEASKPDTVAVKEYPESTEIINQLPLIQTDEVGVVDEEASSPRYDDIYSHSPSSARMTNDLGTNPLLKTSRKDKKSRRKIDPSKAVEYRDQEPASAPSMALLEGRSVLNPGTVATENVDVKEDVVVVVEELTSTIATGAQPIEASARSREEDNEADSAVEQTDILETRGTYSHPIYTDTSSQLTSSDYVAADSRVNDNQVIQQQQQQVIEALSEQVTNLERLLRDAQSQIELERLSSQSQLQRQTNEIESLKHLATRSPSKSQLIAPSSPSEGKISQMENEEHLRQIQQLKEQITRLEAVRDIERIEAAAVHEELEMQNQRLILDLNNIQGENAEIRGKFMKLEVEVVALREKSQICGNDEGSTLTTETALQEAISDLQKQLADTTEAAASIEAERRATAERCEALVQSIAEKDLTIEEVNQKFEELRQRYAVLYDQVSSNNEINAELRQENEELRAAHTSLSQQVDKLDQDLTETLATAGAANRELDQLRSDTSQTTIQNDELKAAVRRLTQDKIAAVNASKQTQTNCDRVQQENTRLSDRVRELSKELKELTEDITILSEDNIKLTDEIREYEQQMEHQGQLRAQLDRAMTENLTLRGDLETQQAQIVNQREELMQMQSSYLQLEEAIRSTENKNRSLMDQLSVKAGESAALAEENEQLMSELQAFSEEVQDSEQRRSLSSDALIFQNSVLQRERDDLRALLEARDEEVERLARLNEEYRVKLELREKDVRVKEQVARIRSQLDDSASRRGVNLSPGSKNVASPGVFELHISDLEPRQATSRDISTAATAASRVSSGSATRSQASEASVSEFRVASRVSGQVGTPTRPSTRSVSATTVAAASLSGTPSSMRYRSPDNVSLSKNGFATPLAVPDRSSRSGNSQLTSAQEPTVSAQEVVIGGLHTDWVRCVSWSPDGSRIATGSHSMQVCVWPAVHVGQHLVQSGDRSVVRLQGHEGWVMGVAWSTDGTALASASFDCTIILWDPVEGSMLHVLRTFSACHCVSWSADSSFVAAGTTDKSSYVWNSETGALVNCLKGHSEPVVSLSWSPVDERVATAAWDAKINLYTLSRGNESPSGPRARPSHRYGSQQSTQEAPSLVLAGHEAFVLCVCWSADGIYIASSSSDCSIRVWDSRSGQCLQRLLGHKEQVTCVSFRPIDEDNENDSCTYLLASSSADNSVRYWDCDQGQPLEVVDNAHSACVTSLCWNPLGRSLATVSVDKYLKVW